MAAKYRLRRIGRAPSLSAVKDVLDIISDITVIGRNKIAADLFLDSKTTTGLISRMHARIIKNQKDGGDQYEICDTSLNGTYVNDRKIFGSVVLNDGDMIAFGHKKGAVIEPGAYAPQDDSEFMYKFEKVHYNFAQKNNEVTGNIALPLYDDVHKNVACSSNTETSPPYTPLKLTGSSCKNDHDTREVFPSSINRVNLSAMLQTPSDAELQSLVKAVASKKENDSDEEFSICTTPLRPSSYAESTTLGTIGALSEKQFVRQRSASDVQEKLTGAKKRKQNLQKENRKRPRSDEGVKYKHDSCASMDCCHPSDPTNTWVQCDDCDQWFHLRCAGLSQKAARKDRQNS